MKMGLLEEFARELLWEELGDTGRTTRFTNDYDSCRVIVSTFTIT